MRSIISAFFCSLVVYLLIPFAQEHPGLYVKGRSLYNIKNEKVFIREINMLGRFRDRMEEKQLPEIVKTGANCCRVFWMTGHRPEFLIPASVFIETLQNCIDNQIVPGFLSFTQSALENRNQFRVRYRMILIKL